MVERLLDEEIIFGVCVFLIKKLKVKKITSKYKNMKITKIKPPLAKI